jgi:hypothetical protein
MNTLTHRTEMELAADLAAVGTEIDRLTREQEIDALAEANLRRDIAEHDPHTPFHRHRVTTFVGSPGLLAICPTCGYSGSRLDDRGGFRCDNCTYTNLDELGHGDDAEAVPPWLAEMIASGELDVDDSHDSDEREHDEGEHDEGDVREAA